MSTPLMVDIEVKTTKLYKAVTKKNLSKILVSLEL